ncbi:hypothetical protein ACSBR1_027938 [Camellia fascicularis]
MASRANKYASLNFNDIYEKKIINPTNNKQHPSSSSQSSPLTTSTKTIVSNSRIHGNMLVLTRPSPKPIPQPQTQSPPHPPAITDQPRSLQDSISLRPLGRTGSGPSLSPLPLTLPKPNKDFSPSSSLSPSPSPNPNPNRFVPPHLRPGFVGREEKPGPELQKQQGVRSREFGGHFGSPNKHGEEGRPKSGGGYERMRRVGDSGPVEMNRPRSSGTRPSSSG